MAVFDPTKYEDEPREETSFFAPEGKYELYFSELSVQSKFDDNGVEQKSFGGKVVFMDGPRAGKYFYHTFWIFNKDKEKQKKALIWFGNFFRAIGVGAVDIEEDSDKLINKTFIGDVYVDEYKGKKNNKLRPWGFSPVGESATSTKPSNSSAPSSESKGSSPRPHEDDLIPF